MKREEILKTIKDSPASMFTKDDVYALIEKLHTLEGEKNNIIECLRITIGETLNSHLLFEAFTDNIQPDSASFSLDYDRIVLEEVDIDTCGIQSILMRNIMHSVETVLKDLMLHVGGSSCDGDCGNCNNSCEQTRDETQESPLQRSDAEDDTSNTPL